MKMIGTIDLEAGPFHVGPLHFEHDGIPTYEECRDLIRQVAYSLWQRAGCPHDRASEFWLQAERFLFWEQDNKFVSGGYRIYVRDLSKPKCEGFYNYYDVVVVGPAGIVALSR